MTIFLFIGDGGSSPSGGKEFAPKIVVGNELAGDTIDNCDYLDSGDCTQLAAALAAAGLDQSDVWIRPGTYSLDEVTSPAGPLVIEAGVYVRGSGDISAVFTGSASDVRTVFQIDSLATLENVSIEVPLGEAGCTQEAVVTLDSGATARKVLIGMEGFSADDSLRAGFDFLSTNARTEECLVRGMSFIEQDPLEATDFFTAYRDTVGDQSSAAFDDPNKIDRCAAVTFDHGVWSTTNAQILEVDLQETWLYGILLQGRAGAGVNGGTIGIHTEANGADTIGVFIEEPSGGVNPQAARVVGVLVHKETAGDTPDIAAGIRSDGADCTITANIVRNADVGVDLTALSSVSVAVGNVGGVTDAGTDNTTDGLNTTTIAVERYDGADPVIMVATDRVIRFDSGADIQLPATAAFPGERFFLLQKNDNGTGASNLLRAGAELINGVAANYVLLRSTDPLQVSWSVRRLPDGNWWVGE